MEDEVRLIIEKVAKKHKITFNQAKDIYDSQFKFMVNKFKSVATDNKFECAILPSLGKFLVNMTKLKKFNDAKIQ